MRPLYGSSLNTMIVVTLGLFLVLYGLTATIWNQTITRNLPQVVRRRPGRRLRGQLSPTSS